MRQFLTIVALSGLGIGLIGCDDGDDNPPVSNELPSVDTSDATSADTTPAPDAPPSSDTGPTPDAPPSGDTSPPAAANACMNEADLNLCDNATTAGDQCPDDQAWAQAAATTCGLGCVGQADPGQCALTCMQNDQGVPVSNECGGCYADIVLCSVENCLPGCLDPSSEACQTCQAENCVPAFYACTGFESDCGDGQDNNGDTKTDCEDPSCEFDSNCTGG